MHLRSTEQQVRRRGLTSPTLVWGLAASFYLVALFHRMSLGVASLDATQRFDLAPGTIAALSALQLGLYLAMTIPAGLAADRVGPRAALAFGLALMAVGETAFGLATTAPVALGGRALVGIGDAFMFLSVLRIAQNWFPAHRYALFATLTGLAGAIGQVGTTVPLGLALDGLGWTGTFVGSGVLTALLVLACLRLVSDHPAGAAAAARVSHDGVARTLRDAWARPATRYGFWAHFGLMGPFVAVTALWGYPWLVTAQGVAPGSARAMLLGAVAAFGVAAPLLGAAVSRNRSLRGPAMLGVAVAATGLWTLTLAWSGGHPPTAVMMAALVATGVGGATSMLAFDAAREGNPASAAGGATGLVNTGGFTAAVVVQIVVGQLLNLDPPGGLQTALIPMAALMLAACVQIARLGRRTARAHVATPTALTGAVPA